MTEGTNPGGKMGSENSFELSNVIGDCSIFQVLITLAANSATMVCAWGIMFMIFGAYNPGWICLDEEMANVSLTQPVMLTTTSAMLHDSNEIKYSMNCSVREKCKNLQYNPDSRTIVTEWDLSCESSAIPSLIISIEMIGALIGSFLGGLIGDKYGRKVSIYGNLALFGICQLISIFSVSWQMYAVLTFFVGLGTTAVVTNTYPYPLEFANVWWRGVIVSIPEWNISLLIFTIAVYFLRNWVYLHIISTAGAALVLLTAIWTPESVRWLTVSGKVNKAKQVVARIARMNGNAFPDTQAIDTLAEEEKAKMGDHSYSYLDLFKVRELRGYSIKLGIIWMTMSIIYHGLSFGLKSISGDFYLNLIISCALEIPAVFCVGFIANTLGRRGGGMLYLSIETACCFLLVILFLTTSDNTKELSVLILALLCKTMVVGTWNFFNTFSIELYPTVLRTMSFGYLVSASRVSTIVSPYVLPDDPDLIYVSFVAIGILALVSLVLTWSLPETKTRELRDIIKSSRQDEEFALEAKPMTDSSEVKS